VVDCALAADHGGDLRHLDAPTLALLTNREVLAVNQASRDNRPHFMADNTPIWSARDEASGDFYVALFNTGSKPVTASLPDPDRCLGHGQAARSLGESRHRHGDRARQCPARTPCQRALPPVTGLSAAC
jgi:hypothetical protein